MKKSIPLRMILELWTILEKNIQKGSMNILNKRLNYILIGFVVFFAPKLLADVSHYKEILVGDRGANMGGAYSAVADDASGAYHNPAGLILGSKESMISISNATNFVYNETSDAVGNEKETEEGWRYLIAFVGYAKRVDNSVFDISYVVDDSTELHQDQFFDNDVIINRRGDDRTYKYGPSWAYKINDKFSWGMTLYAFQREYFLQTTRLNNTGDSSSDWTFTNNRGADFGYQFRTGGMWSVTGANRVPYPAARIIPRKRGSVPPGLLIMARSRSYFRKSLQLFIPVGFHLPR